MRAKLNVAVEATNAIGVERRCWNLPDQKEILESNSRICLPIFPPLPIAEDFGRKLRNGPGCIGLAIRNDLL